MGLKKPIEDEDRIHLVGLKALKFFLPDSLSNADKINKAQQYYIDYHPILMPVCCGSWVATSSKGKVIVAPTEEEAEQLARKHFELADGSDAAFVQCLGSEYVCIYQM